jgi:hypothetical protein
MRTIVAVFAGALATAFIVLGTPIANAEPADACSGMVGAAAMACLQNVKQQMQQNQNACGDAAGCSTGGIPAIVYSQCQQAGVC